jgi:hypothetical protein
MDPSAHTSSIQGWVIRPGVRTRHGCGGPVLAALHLALCLDADDGHGCAGARASRDAPAPQVGRESLAGTGGVRSTAALACARVAAACGWSPRARPRPVGRAYVAMAAVAARARVSAWGTPMLSLCFGKPQRTGGSRTMHHEHVDWSVVVMALAVMSIIIFLFLH